MKIRLDVQAQADLRAIREYLLENASKVAANKVRQHLRTRIQRLAKTPSIGIRTSDPNVRILSPAKYPYRIYFAVDGDVITILHIRHTARRAPAEEPAAGP